MKLSFSTLGCPQWSWEKILDEASALGYDGLELRGIEDEMYLPKSRHFQPGRIGETLAGIREHGLEIVALDTSCAFHDGKDYDAAIREGRDFIDLAYKIGARFIRVFGNKVPKPEEKAETIGRVVSGLKELCRYSEGKNISVLLETHGDFADLGNLSPVLDSMDDGNFGLLWDVAHTHILYGDGLEAFLCRALPFVRHTHIKDVRNTGGGWKHCMTGEGGVPVRAILGMLKAARYDGYLSFEWEKKWHAELEEPEIAMPAYIAYMKNLLR